MLQPEDIVFLPTNSMKAAIKNGGIGTLLGIASILIVATRSIALPEQAAHSLEVHVRHDTIWFYPRQRWATD